jgi:peptidoglycan/xylan/chitin deacetylase (PgdA/CDA1 family)
MKTWLAFGLALTASGAAQADVVLRLPTDEKVVALTLDACEQQRPMKLDTSITDYLVANKIPFTIFLSGMFVRDNAAAVKQLSTLSFVELENHSWDHPLRLQALSDEAVRDEILKTDAEVKAVTGKGTAFFRFPAISYNARTLKLAEDLGFTVVHYRWETGDPDKKETAPKIIEETLWRTRAGDILIHHVNGRGWHSGEAMPAMVEGLKKKGFRFVLLRDYLKDRRAR